ncbi:MAG TPA: hypothetical protein VGV90_05795 [Solirubrobacteraceae bacterium]|nr:hypothetical protein [Solirubrobacteraceae bacterium]
MSSSHTIVIRNATAADAGTLAELAILDSRGPLTGPAVIAEVDGVVRVALDLHDGSVAADPFAHTAKLVELLKSPLLSADRAAMTQPRRSPARTRVVGWSWAQRAALRMSPVR